MVTLEQLSAWIDHELQVATFQDYAPNGVQVEQTSEVKHIVTGVTASLELLETAAQIGADTVLVHHGWFWKNEDPRIVGVKRKRLEVLLRSGINLLAYHLPLDAHPYWGNNAQLAIQLGIEPLLENQLPKVLKNAPLVWLGRPSQAMSQQQFVNHLEKVLARKSIYIGDPHKPLKTIAWCTGGAQNYMQYAIEAGVDLYLTGEASEQNCHLARETRVAFIAAGHHATERYGVQALGKAIAKQFQIKVEHIDIDNPI